jgi:uncharacterized membrane protein (UPF0136 family)
VSDRRLAFLVGLAGVLVLAFGAYGWSTTGSVPSLAAGGGAGVLWLVSAAGIARGRRWGRGLAVGVAVVLGGAMAWRWASTGDPMPGLPVVALSVAVLALVTAGRRAP